MNENIENWSQFKLIQTLTKEISSKEKRIAEDQEEINALKNQLVLELKKQAQEHLDKLSFLLDGLGYKASFSIFEQNGHSEVLVGIVPLNKDSSIQIEEEDC